MTKSKLLSFVLVCVVLSSIAGCAPSAPEQPVASLPDLGDHVVIATMDKGRKVWTWYPRAEAVCVENSYSGAKVFYGNSASTSCSAEKDAPPPVHVLVEGAKVRRYMATHNGQR